MGSVKSTIVSDLMGKISNTVTELHKNKSIRITLNAVAAKENI